MLPVLPGGEAAGSSGRHPVSVTYDHAGRAVYSQEIVAGVLEQLARQGYSPLPYLRVREELARAYAKHGREQWGRHEFYGILLEEVDELWDAIKADEPLARVHEEAVQVAAMCIRYIETGDRYGFT